MTQQAAALDPGVLHRLEAQIATLLTESAVRKQMIRGQRDPATSSPDAALRHTGQQQRGRGPHGPRRRGLACWWCRRRGHREADCWAKQSYQRRRRIGKAGLDTLTVQRGQCKQVVNSLDGDESNRPVGGPCATAQCVKQPVPVPRKRRRRRRRRRRSTPYEHLPPTMPSNRRYKQYQATSAFDRSGSSGYESETELVPVPVPRRSLQPVVGGAEETVHCKDLLPVTTPLQVDERYPSSASLALTENQRQTVVMKL